MNLCRNGDSDFRAQKEAVPASSKEDEFQDVSLRALWVPVRLTFVPPRKANLTFKRSHYLTLSQPQLAAAFPLDVCSLFEICLILPLLMSAALCHPLELREWPEKWWQQSSRFLPAVMMRPSPSIIHHRSLRLTLWWHSGTLLWLIGKLLIKVVWIWIVCAEQSHFFSFILCSEIKRLVHTAQTGCNVMIISVKSHLTNSRKV